MRATAVIRRAPVLLALCAALPGGIARADTVLLGGEARAAAVGILGTGGQFGEAEGQGLCGPNPDPHGTGGDGGLVVDATGVLVVKTPRYVYRLGLSGGYRGYVCTSSLRQVVGALDFRGDHQLTQRIVLSSSLRVFTDAFDRTIDIQSGVTPGNAGMMGTAPAGTSITSGAAGTRYLRATGGEDLSVRFAGRYGLRAAMGADALEILAPPGTLSQYTTLGPMEALQLQAAGFWDNTRHRFELPLRYRISHYYPATVQPGPGRTGDQWHWDQVPPAQDGSVRFAYEYHPSPVWTLRAEAGLAFAYQPNLCLQRGQREIENSSCSIDLSAPGIRGALGGPPLEAGLGRQATGTLVGEVTLRYITRRHLLELSLTRDYEPNPFAGALDLADRLALNYAYRPDRDLTVITSAQLGHDAHTALGQVCTDAPDPSDPTGCGNPGLQTVSPQNRTMYMAQGAIGVDYKVARAFAIFLRLDLQAFGIQGQRVLGTPSGKPDEPRLFVSSFPQPPGGAVGGVQPLPDGFQTVWRLGLALGVRVFALPSTRDENALIEARAVP